MKKVTGMVRKIDDLGRIVIPKEIRRTMGISGGTSLEIYISKEGIILKKNYQRSDLSDLLQSVNEAIEDVSVELEPEKAESIRRSIEDIKTFLN